MVSPSSLFELSFAELGARIAASDPLTGACGAAALSGALGAATTSMALRRSAGEGAERIWADGRADELDRLRERLGELADEERRALEGLAAADEAPAGEVAAGERAEKLARARERALEAPFEVAETALAALRLAAVGASRSAAGAPSAGGTGGRTEECADARFGLRCLEASLRAALAVVKRRQRAFGDERFESLVTTADLLEAQADELLKTTAGTVDPRA